MGKLNSAINAFLNKLRSKSGVVQHTTAVIVAGGKSSRMGKDVSKQWISLGGIPVIAHTVHAFDRAETVKDIILVIRKDEEERYHDFAAKYNVKKPLRIVAGGETRQQSAKNGFLACAETAKYVAFHDGARFLITPEEIDRVCKEAYIHDAATAAVRVQDTVKSATESGFIDQTLNRDNIWLAQTPQVFKTAVYHAAIAMAQKDDFTATDDCSLVEHIQHPVYLVECSKDNFKLTTRNDLIYAKAVLSERKRKGKTV